MSKTGRRRLEVVKSLLPERVSSLLDIGSGTISADYPFLENADSIVCIDWRLRIIGAKPEKIKAVEGDFLDIEFGGQTFDAIVCADVFEHILLERESDFADRCCQLLKPDGTLVLSTPHLGRYAWLDPYEVKSRLHRILASMGFYQGPHNGFCDIRKGHKHYTEGELVDCFSPLEPVKVERWGYLYDPLASWSDAIDRKLGVAPWRNWVEHRLASEYAKDPGQEAFNIAIRFRKPGV